MAEAPTKARIAYLARLYFSNADSPETFEQVGQIGGDLAGPGATADVIEATHMESPGGYKEYISGLIDGGEMTVPLFLDPRDESQDDQTGVQYLLKNRLRRKWRVAIPMSPEIYLEFTGIVTAFNMDFPREEKMMATITLKVAGALAWVEPA